MKLLVATHASHTEGTLLKGRFLICFDGGWPEILCSASSGDATAISRPLGEALNRKGDGGQEK